MYTPVVGIILAALLPHLPAVGPGPSSPGLPSPVQTVASAARVFAETAAGDSVPLYDDLGDHHMEITTSVPAAQDYFDQGLRLYYAFNHAEAIRSFREAQRRDPDCLMCYWGEALAWGPNINMPMDSAGAVAAHAAVRSALAVREEGSARERAYVDALARRYEATPRSQRAPLDSAYARAMAGVAASFPDDDDAAVLYAESLMDLRPWDYWVDTTTPAPGIAEALGHLERVMARSPDHPGACHFFIHAVEEVQPERAVPCAERLADLMPGAGHIVHMPGHIYIRVGRYRDAVEANEHAVHADETWMADQRPGATVYTAGYYPHNYDFLAFAAAMAGMPERAVEAAGKVAALVPREMLGVEGMTFLQQFLTRPLQLRVRFGLWEEILGAEEPSEDLPHARGMWHYARGRALAATGDPDGARAELRRLRALAASDALADARLEFNPAPAVLGVGEAVLEGMIAFAAGDTASAVTALREAVRREDALDYGEPPEWTVPVREELGAVLLRSGRPDAAERVFREDLERFPGNVWSLEALAESLERQGRLDEAAETRRRLHRARSGDGGAPHGSPGPG